MFLGSMPLVTLLRGYIADFTRMKYISKDPPCPPYEANPVGVLNHQPAVGAKHAVGNFKDHPQVMGRMLRPYPRGSLHRTPKIAWIRRQSSKPLQDKLMKGGKG
jgi:hypothetical protein